MGQGYRRAPGDSVQPIVDAQKELADRASRLESPTGTSLSKLVAQVKAAIVGINAQVIAAVAALPSITVPGLIRSSAGGVQAATTVIAGTTVTAGTGISTSSGDVSTPAGLRGADVYATNAPTFNITGGRVTAWWETATGRGGFASSSRRFKTNIEPVEVGRMRMLLAVGVVHFDYIAEVRKRDDPTYEDYVGPDYHVGRNLSSIAEDLHEQGLWEFVIYEREDVMGVELQTSIEVDDEGVEHEVEHEVEVKTGDRLKLDESGEPIPLGIHESLLPYALIVIAREHDDRIAAIEGILGIGTPLI